MSGKHYLAILYLLKIQSQLLIQESWLDKFKSKSLKYINPFKTLKAYESLKWDKYFSKNEKFSNKCSLEKLKSVGKYAAFEMFEYRMRYVNTWFISALFQTQNSIRLTESIKILLILRYESAWYLLEFWIKVFTRKLHYLYKFSSGKMLFFNRITLEVYIWIIIFLYGMHCF